MADTAVGLVGEGEFVLRQSCHIVHVEGSPIHEGAHRYGVAPRLEARDGQVSARVHGGIVRSSVEQAVFLFEQPPDVRIAEASGPHQNGVERSLKVGRRRRDVPKYVSSRRMPLQGLTKAGVAVVELLEQPRILDGDDGLIREGLDERDLALAELPGHHTRYREDADSLTLAHERHGQRCTSPTMHNVRKLGEDRRVMPIRDMDRPSVEQRVGGDEGPHEGQEPSVAGRPGRRCVTPCVSGKTAPAV